jgi:hypothetical protein
MHKRLEYNLALKRNEFTISSKYILNDIDFINNNKIECIMVNIEKGYKNKNLDFLEHIPHIKFLTIVSEKIIDFQAISFLEKLEELYVSEPPFEVNFDFSKNKSLQSLNISTINFKGARNISELTLRECNIQNDFLNDFIYLENLSLIKCKGFSNLSILYTQMPLKSLDLSYLPNLNSIDPIQIFSKTIKELQLVNCKNIDNLDLISNCLLLEKIIIDNAGTLSSTSILRKLKKLSFFTLAGKSSYFKNIYLNDIKKEKFEHLYIEKLKF